MRANAAEKKNSRWTPHGGAAQRGGRTLHRVLNGGTTPRHSQAQRATPATDNVGPYPRCAARGGGTPRRPSRPGARGKDQRHYRWDGYNVPSERSGGSAEGSWLRRHPDARGERGCKPGRADKRHSHPPTSRPTGARHQEPRGGRVDDTAATRTGRQPSARTAAAGARGSPIGTGQGPSRGGEGEGGEDG